MTDSHAKSALTISILVGVALGIVWAWCQYKNLIDARSWNLMGLTTILCVAGTAGFVALTQFRKRS